MCSAVRTVFKLYSLTGRAIYALLPAMRDTQELQVLKKWYTGTRDLAQKNIHHMWPVYMCAENYLDTPIAAMYSDSHFGRIKGSNITKSPNIPEAKDCRSKKNPQST